MSKIGKINISIPEKVKVALTGNVLNVEGPLGKKSLNIDLDIFDLNINDGKEITLLEYEAYRPMADKVLEQVAAEMVDSWNLGAVAIGHRLGPVKIGEISMVIATSSPHRRDAFEACQFAVKRIKQIVPIWKKEYFEGGDVWIGDEKGFRPLNYKTN